MKITNARLVLPPVAGNPAAVYFDLANDGDRGVALNRAAVKGAKSAMFHDYGEYDFKVQMMDMLPVPLKKGDEARSSSPAASTSWRWSPIASLKAGGKAEVTVIVSAAASRPSRPKSARRGTNADAKRDDELGIETSTGRPPAPSAASAG